MKKNLVYLLAVLLLIGNLSCSKEDIIEPENNEEEQPTVYELTYRYSDLIQNNMYHISKQNLLSPEEFQLESSSGLVTGRNNLGYVYICQGKGFRTWHPQDNPPEIYIYNDIGEYKGKMIIKGAENFDWQDIAIGSPPNDNKNYIYIGDIGDKENNRESLKIYRFEEPVISQKNDFFEIEISNFDIIEFTLPEHGARDCETLMFDPKTGDLIVMAKMQAFVYRLSYPQSTNAITEAVYKGHHRLRREIKAGDISPCGNLIMIKDVGEIFQWEKPENMCVIETMFTIPATISIYANEPEGGALGWKHDSSGYFSITDTDISSEGNRRAEPILYGYYK